MESDKDVESDKDDDEDEKKLSRSDIESKLQKLRELRKDVCFFFLVIVVALFHWSTLQVRKNIKSVDIGQTKDEEIEEEEEEEVPKQLSTQSKTTAVGTQCCSSIT